VPDACSAAGAGGRPRSAHVADLEASSPARGEAGQSRSRNSKNLQRLGDEANDWLEIRRFGGAIPFLYCPIKPPTNKPAGRSLCAPSRLMYLLLMNHPVKKDHSVRNQILLALFSAIVGGLISWVIVLATRHEQTAEEAQKAQAEARQAAGVQLESRLVRLEATVEDAHRRIDGIKLVPSTSTSNGVGYGVNQETVAPDIHEVMVGIQDGTGGGQLSHNVYRRLDVTVPGRVGTH
jgi:hypothetical protein